VTATCRPPAEIKRYQESPHFSLKTQIIGIPFKTRKQNVIPHYTKIERCSPSSQPFCWRGNKRFCVCYFRIRFSTKFFFKTFWL